MSERDDMTPLICTAAEKERLMDKIAALRSRVSRLERVVAAAVVMREAMRRAHADPRYMNVWAIAQSHVGPYEGATYTDEMLAFDAALAGGGK